MSRWFRWYDGTSEDGKFRVVARLSRVTVRDVIALWAFMLEDASNLSHRGVCNRNEDFMAAILDFEEGVVETILGAMEDTGLISVGAGAITICNWGKRQFEGDADPTAADRQRRKRERDKETVTPLSRVTHAPQITETDTDNTDANASVVVAEPTTAFDRKKSEDREKLRTLGEQWNAVAAELHLPQIEEIKPGSPRERAALARIRDGCDYDRVFAKIRGSPFLRGDRGSTPAAFDWITNPTNYVKIIEGNYDEIRQAKPGAFGGLSVHRHHG